MKVHLSDAATLAEQFPITDRLPGWFFRITERSAGAYRVEGIDLRNRRVSTEGTDADSALSECIAMAHGIAKANP